MMSRAAPWPRESHTAAMNRAHSHVRSSSFAGGGETWLSGVEASADVE